MKVETSKNAPPFRNSLGIAGTLCPNGCGDHLVIYLGGTPEWYFCMRCDLRISSEELRRLSNGKDGEMKDRFKIVEGSQTGHGCCFEYTVVDTSKPVIIGGKQYENEKGTQFEMVCECYEKETAEWLCDAMNRKDRMGKG